MPIAVNEYMETQFLNIFSFPFPCLEYPSNKGRSRKYHVTADMCSVPTAVLTGLCGEVDSLEVEDGDYANNYFTPFENNHIW